MNFRSSSYTQRAHRTLESAFGPHTSREIQEPDRPFDWQDVVVIVGSALSFIGWVLVMVL